MTEFNDCWKKIGVEGDRSCPELETHIHCRNCPVYSAAGRGLLEREAPEGYLEEWTNLLAQSQQISTLSDRKKSAIQKTTRSLSVTIFRLGNEWMALPAKLFKEITPPTPIHTLPHRSNDLFLGLANVRGEILMCVSLFILLGIDRATQAQSKMSPVVYERMVVVEVEGYSWAFAVDEIYGVHRVREEDLRPPPVALSKSEENYTISTINWQDQKVNYLDSELLFYTLQRRVL
ncbi:MAG TPA: purine-binding chemotaxis protein CheW [Oscillatoriales cyanobacterium M59_W2019_021]|nr:purine-binding chemotaxis protein CheW [Oscillatoriales cyanobacterium M4454_W2019_049]HIK52045.1 purine-binding chemotaxis protein CheW [Oscillatoriales cyanobacterium M59_W2019_021]